MVGVNLTELWLAVDARSENEDVVAPENNHSKARVSPSEFPAVPVRLRKSPISIEEPVADGACPEHVEIVFLVTVQLRVVVLTAFEAVATKVFDPESAELNTELNEPDPTLVPSNVHAILQLPSLATAAKEVLVEGAAATLRLAPEGVALEIEQFGIIVVDHEQVRVSYPSKTSTAKL